MLGQISDAQTGDEASIEDMEARVNEFDVHSGWERHDRLRRLMPRPRDDTPSPAGRLHNVFEGVPGAWQLSETVDDFLIRLSPATTDWQLDIDWIRIANPFIPGEGKQGLEEFVRGGSERLRLFSEFVKMSSASGRSKFVVGREVSKERAAVIRDLCELATACNVLSGKWMLFPEPGQVNAVWSVVAHATANNELGTAAKTETRVASNKERLICVYTKDFRNKADVARVLNRLRQLELVRVNGKQIYYKSGWFRPLLYSPLPPPQTNSQQMLGHT